MSTRSRERRGQLLEALVSGEVDVDQLALRFAVSASTIRRDLQRLSDEKAIRRTYGGAILAKQSSESTLDERLSVNGAAKREIADVAGEFIRDGDTIIVDAGSTVAALGRLLRGRTLRIVTNNLALLSFLGAEPDLELIVLGGSLRATSMSTVGPLAMEAMRRITAERLFTSADGVVAGRGLCEASLDQVALKSLMMQQAREVVVLADASKLGRADHGAWAPLPPRFVLVTDSSAPKHELVSLSDAGAEIHVARRRP